MRVVMVLLFAMLVVLMPLPVCADLGPLDAAVMPGEVIQGHATIEKECRSCHVPFRKSAQQGLCLDCHDHANIAQDIRMKQGFHGRLKEQACNTCHTEHKGRARDIVQLNEKAFDHAQTDFPLKGGHAKPKVQCKDCHRPNEKHHVAPTACIACHKKDDTHKGRLGKDCQSCHVDTSWDKVRFDHSKTGYPLKGKHADAECKTCHANERYKPTPTACVACHRKDDDKKGHKGRFGAKCESCHSEREWKHITFDHDRDTKYRLRGKHARTTCQGCHKGQLYKEKLKTTCISCHKKDDAHRGQEGTRCEQCHSETSWNKAVFDHGLTRFPLLGKHAKTKCSECHAKPTYKDAPIECAACHKKDDVHKRRLGPACGQCHNARAWREWDFDHGTRTDFPLDGGHKGLDCLACHKQATDKKVALAGTCQSCHRRDDVHDGRFGPLCAQCHVTTSFTELKAGFSKPPSQKKR